MFKCLFKAGDKCGFKRIISIQPSYHRISRSIFVFGSYESLECLDGHLNPYTYRQSTLSFYNNEPSKNKHFLILLLSLARNSREHKLKRIFEIRWVLFEKSLSLTDLNPGFGGPWNKLWIFLVYGTFIIHQKKSFGQFFFFFFEFHAWVQKCRFGRIKKLN